MSLSTWPVNRWQLRVDRARRGRHVRHGAPSLATPIWRHAWPNSRLPCTRPTCFRLSEELCKTKDGVINVNMEDDAIRGLTVIKDGAVTRLAHPSSKRQLRPLSPAAPGCQEGARTRWSQRADGRKHLGNCFWGGRGIVLAGWCVCTSGVPGAFHRLRAGVFCGLHGGLERHPSLHTPLMSVTNAISSIIAIGALVQIAPPQGHKNGFAG